MRQTTRLTTLLCLVAVAGCTPAGAGTPSSTAAAPTAAPTTAAATATPAVTSAPTVDPTAAPTSTPAASDPVSPPPLRIRATFDGSPPAGWEVSAEGTLLSFATTGDGPGMTIEMLSDWVVSAADCGLGPEPEIGVTAAAIADAIAERRGINVLDRRTVELDDGQVAHVLDLAVDQTVGPTCPVDDAGYVPLVGSLQSDGWVFVGVAPDERIRLVVLDSLFGKSLVILVVAPDAASFKRYQADAKAIIGKLSFDAVP